MAWQGSHEEYREGKKDGGPRQNWLNFSVSTGAKDSKIPSDSGHAAAICQLLRHRSVATPRVISLILWDGCGKLHFEEEEAKGDEAETFVQS